MPAVKGSPLTKPSKSLTTMGTPRNGPSGSDQTMSRAASYIGCMTAFSTGLTASMAAMAFSTSSIGWTSPRRTRAASSVASQVM